MLVFLCKTKAYSASFHCIMDQTFRQQAHSRVTGCQQKKIRVASAWRQENAKSYSFVDSVYAA